MSTHMEFLVLGPLEVRAEGGAPVGIAGGKPRALLALLLLEANRPVSAERIATALWGDEAPADSVKAVRVVVSRLRRSLDEGALTISPAGYRLRVLPGELDSDRFAGMVAEATAALEAHDPVTAAGVLRQALSMWRGPPLADVAFAGFAQAAVAGLDEQRLAALELRIDAELEVGRDRDVVAELQRLVTDHPLRERLHGQLMLALYRSGRQAEALEVYRRFRAWLVDELGLEPGAELRALEASILGQDPSLSGQLVAPSSDMRSALREALEPVRGPDVRGLDARVVAGNDALGVALPRPPTRLIGREPAVEEVTDLLLRPSVRLLTLAGAGGVGKTRLALEAAHRAVAHFADGTRVAWLGALTEPDDVPAAIARAVGGTSADRLVDDLARQVLLLLVDNCEHVLDAMPLLAEIARSCPGVTVVATSRELLRIGGEYVFHVEPLDTAAAVELFADRATALDGAFRLNGEVPALCSRLDGLPLAIELAAARTGVLAPGEISDRLDELMAAPGARDAPARQRTLRATIEWSVRLSSPAEQDALAGLAVFSGGCTAAAARAVTGASLGELEALTAKSLLRRRDGRLTMLATIAEYAGERLADRPDREAIARRHAEWCLAVAHEHAPRILIGAAEAERALNGELANFLHALTWARDHDGAMHAELVTALRMFWWVENHWQEALPHVEAALGGAHRRAMRAQLRYTRGMLRDYRAPGQREDLEVALRCFESLGDEESVLGCLLSLVQGDTARSAWADARPLSLRAIDLARRLGDDVLVGRALSVATLAHGTLRRARPLADAAIGPLRRAGAFNELAMTLSNVAFLAIKEEAYTEAEELLAQALPAARASRAPTPLGQVASNIGLVALFTGRPDDAAWGFAEELRHARDGHYPWALLGEALLGLAAVAALRGEPDQAASLAGAAEAAPSWGDYGINQVVLARVRQSFLEPARAALGEPAWERARRAGASLPRHEAVASALRVAALQPA